MSAIITALPTSRSFAPRRTAASRHPVVRSAAPATSRVVRATEYRAHSATRRPSVGVMALVGLAVVAAVALGGLFGARAAADAVTAGRPTEPVYVIAEPGDTLWSIAARIAPNASITEVVDQLVVLNGTSITAGQAVRIP
jgi:Tfp pilus assembly protein FimV